MIGPTSVNETSILRRLYIIETLVPSGNIWKQGSPAQATERLNEEPPGLLVPGRLYLFGRIIVISKQLAHSLQHLNLIDDLSFIFRLVLDRFFLTPSSSIEKA